MRETNPIELWRPLGPLPILALFDHQQVTDRLRRTSSPTTSWSVPGPEGAVVVRTREGTRRGRAAQGRRHTQLPSGGRGRRHPARVTQDGVPLGQGGQAALHEDPGTCRRAPSGADGLSWPTTWSPSVGDNSGALADIDGAVHSPSCSLDDE